MPIFQTPQEWENHIKNVDENMKELYRRVNKDPCLNEDCSDILSPCCQAVVETIFGTLPLQVKCVSCQKQYILRSLLK